MAEEDIIEALKNAGISDKKIKLELEESNISVDTPKTLGKFRSTPERVNISDIGSGMGNKSITTYGFIIGKRKGRTRCDNPKVTLTLTDGKSTTRALVFDEAYKQYEAQKFDFFDKIKFEGAKIFEFTSDKRDDIIILTAGKFTMVSKLDKDIKNVMTPYAEADVGTMAIAYGIVMETSEVSYFGCPDCSKKGDAKDADTEFECECGYSGLPLEHIIVNANVSDGEESTIVTIFPRLKILAKDIAYKPVVVVGKKSDDKLMASAVRVYDITKKNGAFFKKDEDFP